MAGSRRRDSSSPTRTWSRGSARRRCIDDAGRTLPARRRRVRPGARPRGARGARARTRRRSPLGDGARRRRRRGLRASRRRAAAAAPARIGERDRRGRHRHLPHGDRAAGTCSCSRRSSRPATRAARSSNRDGDVIGVAFAIDPGRSATGYALTDDGGASPCSRHAAARRRRRRSTPATLPRSS